MTSPLSEHNWHTVSSRHTLHLKFVSRTRPLAHADRRFTPRCCCLPWADQLLSERPQCLPPLAIRQCRSIRLFPRGDAVISVLLATCSNWTDYLRTSHSVQHQAQLIRSTAATGPLPQAAQRSALHPLYICRASLQQGKQVASSPRSFWRHGRSPQSDGRGKELRQRAGGRRESL